jgi:hypothetical protein
MANFETKGKISFLNGEIPPLFCFCCPRVAAGGVWLLGWLILICVEEANTRPPRESRRVTSPGRAGDALGSLGAILRLSLKEPLEREKEVFATWERAVAI